VREPAESRHVARRLAAGLALAERFATDADVIRLWHELAAKRRRHADREAADIEHQW
jgi:hypothetical protein